MLLNDTNINVFVSKSLHLGQGKRKEHLKQVDHLIEELEKKIHADSSLKVTGFKKTGSLVKGTVLKPKGDYGVDADVAIFLDVSESKKDDIDDLHQIIHKLLVSVYPTKPDSDFKIQPRTLGIHFRVSGLDVDLVPVIKIPSEPGYGWQPSSKDGDPIKTNIQAQLDFIKNRKAGDPRFKTLVRLLKNWRNFRELDFFRSYTIELILAHIYDVSGPAESYNDGLTRFFLYIARTKLQTPISFPELGVISNYPNDAVVILDPVNKENNVAMRLTETERQEVVSEALTAWETIEAANWREGILCTNHYNTIDPAILRRAAYVEKFDRPNDEQRRSLFTLDCKDLGLSTQAIEKLVKLTGPEGPHKLGYTYSDIRTRIFPDAVASAYPSRKIFEADFIESISKIIPSPSTDT